MDFTRGKVSLQSAGKTTLSTHYKLYEHHFYKAGWKELDRIIEGAKKRKGGKYENQNQLKSA
jgi:hypothetical protein